MVLKIKSLRFDISNQEVLEIVEVSFGREHVVEIELVVHFSANLLSHVGTVGDLSHDVALLLEALWVDLSPGSSSDLGTLVNDVSGSIEARPLWKLVGSFMSKALPKAPTAWDPVPISFMSLSPWCFS